MCSHIAFAPAARFMQKLPEIFESFNVLLRGVTGRMTAAHLKEQVLRVLSVWEAWSLYPQPFITSLQETFLRKELQTETNADQPGMKV